MKLWHWGLENIFSKWCIYNCMFISVEWMFVNGMKWVMSSCRVKCCAKSISCHRRPRGLTASPEVGNGERGGRRRLRPPSASSTPSVNGNNQYRSAYIRHISCTCLSGCLYTNCNNFNPLIIKMRINVHRERLALHTYTGTRSAVAAAIPGYICNRGI